ncbi:MAG: hypothetical protein NZ602_03450 [Thermoguttaceae bacterium]|nr:hypothetical protein [Thermoguttaceae bacterium]
MAPSFLDSLLLAEGANWSCRAEQEQAHGDTVVEQDGCSWWALGYWR